MDRGFHSKKVQSRIIRSTAIGSTVAAVVLVMLIAAAMPTAADNPMAPDLVIDELSVSIDPTPLVEGVTSQVSFEVANVGVQNSYALMVSLFDHGKEVANASSSSLLIGGFWYPVLDWTPTIPGTYDIELRAWYGPHSEKQDVNSADNSVFIEVTVLSRPDASLSDADLTYTAPNHDYVIDGEMVTVRAVVHNQGSAPIEGCNVTLWEGAVGGTGTMVDRYTGVTVPGEGQTQVAFPWNTTGWSGKRRLYVQVTAVRPNETDLRDNVAMFEIKVHTKEDRVFTTRGNLIKSAFKQQFFITIEGNGDLTIDGRRYEGNVSVYQDFDEQYDIMITDQGKLVIDGGILWSEMNFTLFLYDSAVLELKNMASSNLRIVATGDCTINIMDSVLDAPSFHMTGGTLHAEGSNITAGVLDLDHVDLMVEGGSISTGETIYIRGGTATIRDCAVEVAREFPAYMVAAEMYPSLDEADPDTNEVKYLPPALMATSGAVVDLVNVSAETQVYIVVEDRLFWSKNRLGAQGTGSFINVYRYLNVEVRDWSDQLVIGAEVEVLDYFNEMVMVNGTTNESGDVTLEMMTDYITPAQKPFVGNVRVRAMADTRTSEDLALSHNKYPKMDFESNTMTVRIEMPPNPYPVDVEKKRTFVADHEISGGESAIDQNIIIDNCELTLRDTRFTLEQERDFEWFILVKGDNGALNIINSTVRSDFLFTIFLEDGATLNMSLGSYMYDVRLIASDVSTIQIMDSELEGGMYTQCAVIETVRSMVTLDHTHMEASTISLTGGYFHEHSDMVIKANDLHIVDLELSGYYEMNEQTGIVSIKDLVRFFGWSLLNNIEYLTNISLGYFDAYAADSNITIQTSDLTVLDSLIYATYTSIEVKRSPLPDQADIRDSWVGGITLKLVSDDLRAWDTSFNRVLNGFKGNDFVRLYSVQVPGIVCFENAEVERYWAITVNAFDGAGSITAGALLEVYSTETDDKILPLPGTEGLTTSRTNPAGRLKVHVLANMTDATGDYFVGAVYIRLKYDEDLPEPYYTPFRQLVLKSDVEVTLRFLETIEPPEKEIQYCMFTVNRIGTSQDLKIYNHTFGTLDEAVAFLAMVNGIEPDRTRDNWTLVRDIPINMTFVAKSKINDVWRPLANGEVKIYILTGHNPRFDANKIATWPDGTDMVYTVTTDVNGWGNATIIMPSNLDSYQMYIAISGGKYDPEPIPIDNRTWNFVVEPPKTIIIDPTATILSSNPVIVGSLVTVTGYVRYNYTHLPVEGAEITISGTHVSTANGRTDREGRFAIQIQAPVAIWTNLSLHIRAEDTRTDENNTFILAYEIIEEPTSEEDEGLPWAIIWTIIILAVLGFAIAFGAVMMYRKHYGEIVECGECGAFIPASSTACPKCGIEFETDLARCSECEAWIPANSSACPVCGTAFTIESLEEMVAREEADEELAPIDQVTTSTAKLAPLTLEGSSQATKWGDREEKRRRRIKKRVKKRLTVTDTLDDGEETDEDSKDLFVGEDADSTRLPGLGLEDTSLGEEDLTGLLPTEDMLKDLMLTSEAEPPVGETEAMEPEGELDLEEHLDEEPSPEPEEIPLDEDMEPEALEEIPPPDEPMPDDEEPLDEEMPEPEEDEGPESRELLSELGLVAPESERLDLDEDEEPEDEGALTGLLAEEEESKEAPKLCPNCGGNWILYKDGEYTCRICGEKW